MIITTIINFTEGHDVLDSAFTGSANQYDSLQFRTSEFAGTSSDPVLEVTYSIPGTGITLQDLSYTYDAVGNITQIVDSSSTDSAKTTDYVYDDLYRLTSATISGAASGSNETITYTYNILGNITYRSDLGTYTYAGDTSTTPATRYANPHAVTSILKTDGTTANFSYDANGNVKTDGTLTMTWDYKNRLVSSRTGVTTTTYAYNPGDARASKTTGTTTTYYPSFDYSVKGNTSTVYISGASGPVASIANDGTSSIINTIHTDHLGSTSVVTDANAVMVELLDYYPYGTERISWSRDSSSAESQKTYIGEYSDDESGLSYLNARYYDPHRGQFLSQDSVFLSVGVQIKDDAAAMIALLDPQSQNSYSYTRGNPVTLSDSTGNFWGEDALNQAGAWGDSFLNTLGSFVPGYSDARDLVGAVFGYDFHTNEYLTEQQQQNYAFGFMIPIIGGSALGRYGDEFFDAARYTNRQIIDRGIYRGGGGLRLGTRDLERYGDGSLKGGLSLNTDPSYTTETFGSAYRMVDVPDGLQIVQKGNRQNHYVITPVDPYVSDDEFQELIDQIILEPIN